MPPIQKSKSHTSRSEQVVLNKSMDDKYDILAVELLGYDPIDDSLHRITTSAFGEYVINDNEQSGNTQYLGKENPSGNWMVQKITRSGVMSIRYATVQNNESVTSYSDAWTNRASLSYGTYSQAL